MKSFLLLTLMMCSFSAFAEVTDIVRWKPEANASHEQVVEAVKKLKSMSTDVKGLISKKTYYDKDSKSWIDIVVWTDRASADAFEASKKDKPELAEIGKVIDLESVSTSSYSEVE